MSDASLLLKDLQARLERAADEIVELKELLRRHRAVASTLQLESDLAAKALRSYDELRELHDFWKSAAERALRLWDKAQDDSEKLRNAIENALTHPATALNRKIWHELEAALDDGEE